MVDAQAGKVYLPDAKRAAYRREVQHFRLKYLDKKQVPRKELEKLVGKLCFAARNTKWGFSFLQECFDSLYASNTWQKGLSRGATVTLTPGAREELLFWDGLLYNKHCYLLRI